MSADLLILGCGFTGTEVAKRALAAGFRVVATTRREEGRAAAERLGIEIRVLPALTRDRVRELVQPGAFVLATFPPDGHTDREIAPALAAARHVAYISTTGVYGAHRGHVDEATHVDPSEPRAKERLDAENAYLDRGATVLRAAGIYGPGRGLHVRMKSGTFRVPGDGTNVVSRIHVADLAELALGAFRRAAGDQAESARGRIFVVADDTPVPQIEVIRWLASELGLPMPAHAAIGEVPPTLRHDRAVDNRRIKAWTGVSLLYPGYREGFAACFAEERRHAEEPRPAE
ncbi:MAG: NAD-dependent epimerase/dehydratase family protein [Polyangiaceae bacterium]